MNYKSDIRELDAEVRGLHGAETHLCKAFGKRGGRQIFDEYVRHHMVDHGSRYFLPLGKHYTCPDDAYNAFRNAYSKALANPLWYPNRVAHDRGINSSDMVLRVLSDKKWDGADKIIQQSSGYSQSCRRILALCVQEDLSVLHGLKGLGISLESEFPAEFLEKVQKRSLAAPPGFANEYEFLRKDSGNWTHGGHLMRDCRVAIVDSWSQGDGDFVFARVIQACDLVGKNCPVSPEPDLVSIPLRRKDGKNFINYFVKYTKEDYDAMMGVANMDGDLPVLYGDLLPYSSQGWKIHFRVAANRVRPSSIPFSSIFHRQHVEEAKRALPKTIPSEAARYIPPLPPDLPPVGIEEELGLDPPGIWDDPGMSL